MGSVGGPEQTRRWSRRPTHLTAGRGRRRPSPCGGGHRPWRNRGLPDPIPVTATRRCRGAGGPEGDRPRGGLRPSTDPQGGREPRSSARPQIGLALRGAHAAACASNSSACGDVIRLHLVRSILHQSPVRGAHGSHRTPWVIIAAIAAPTPGVPDEGPGPSIANAVSDAGDNECDSLHQGSPASAGRPHTMLPDRSNRLPRTGYLAADLQISTEYRVQPEGGPGVSHTQDQRLHHLACTRLAATFSTTDKCTGIPFTSQLSPSSWNATLVRCVPPDDAFHCAIHAGTPPTVP